jgi:tripartite-type tricarboxylate transporter receptor subunit TctC
MSNNPLRISACFLAAGALSFVAAPSIAADFYAGKTITIIAPTNPGGTYDRMCRLTAKFLPKHIPGKPSAVVQNRPGGGTVIGTRAAYKSKADGLTLLHVPSTIVVRRLTGGIKDLDFEKFNWLGSVGGAHYVFVVRNERKEKTIAEFQKASPPIRVAVSGPASLLTQMPKFLQRAGGFKIKLVSGYKSYSPMTLATKQKEVEGFATAAAAVIVNPTSRQMYSSKEVRLAISMGGAPAHKKIAADVAKLPKFADVIADPLDKQAYIAFSGLLNASRPFVTTPGVPADRVAILRKAMEAMMADPEFIEAATKQGFVLNPLNGAEAEKLIL